MLIYQGKVAIAFVVFFIAFKVLFKSRKMKENGIPLYIYPAEIHPFAFFSKVVVPENALKGKAFHMILKHEMVHIREKHWLDNLTSELLCTVQWFNPFAWMMKGALKRNLEFQADNKVVASHDAETYQMALVSMANTQGPGTFLTAINSSDLKTRIKMMKMKTENKYAFVKKLVVLPLLAILVMGLSNKEVKTEILPINKTEIRKGKIIKGKVTDEKGILIEGASVEVKGKKYGVITDKIGNYKIEIEPNDETLIYGYLYHDKKEVKIDGKTEINVQLNTDGNPAMDGIFLHNSFRIKSINGELAKPIYIVDGKEVVDINSINPDKIEQISVLKGESGFNLYGEKGKNGVVLITSKTNNKIAKSEEIKETRVDNYYRIADEINGIQIKGNDKNPPLYLVDGKEVKNITDLKPEDIEMIEVLKDKPATDLYGEKGKNGVISIKMKDKTADNKTIANSQQLRRAIAERIKYPVSAQQAGQTGKIELYAEIGRDGKINQLSETAPAVPFETLDEVVIVAYGTEKPVPPTVDFYFLRMLKDESKRVIQSFPKIEIPELQGKWVKFQFNFLLQ